MTGPEHYRTAELLLETKIQDKDLPPDVAGAYASVAQVHATLALVSATAAQLDNLQHAEWWGKEVTP